MDKVASSRQPTQARAPASAPAARAAAAPETLDLSPRGQEMRQFADLARFGPAAVAQRRELRSLFGAVAPVQQKTENTPDRALESRQGPQSSNGGLPAPLKAGVEALSGVSMSDVRVHYDSGEPAQLNAHAFAQGKDIHIAPGQEQHLPHEAWHVAQQAQGRVRPTRQMKGGAPINEDPELEREADVMGQRALQTAAIARPPAPVLAPTGTLQRAKRKNKEREQSTRAHQWDLLLRQRVPAAAAISTALTGAVANEPGLGFPSLEVFAAGLAPLAWNAANLTRLIRKFLGSAGGRSAPEWTAVAVAHANLANQEDDVATFARIGNWAAANLANLAGLFGANPGGRTAREWAAVAIAHANLVNQEANVAEFARIQGNWTPANLATLAGLFGANRGGRTAQEWAAVAVAHANLADQEANVAEFARIQGNWTPANLATLAGLFGANPGGRTAQEWAAVAVAHANLADQEADVAEFARIQGNWTPANLATLAGLFGANPGGRTAQEWAAVAVANANLADQEADVAEFARIQGGWTPANLATLAGLFGAAAGGRTAQEWAAIAVAHADLADEEAVVAGLARAAWVAADAANFVTQALAAGANAVTMMGLLAVVGVPASTRAMIVAGWGAADLGAFTGGMLQGGVPSATVAGFLATANMPAATVLMRASWQPGQLANFVVGAVAATATAAAMAPLFLQANFPATSHGLIGGTWNATHVGEFCGGALVANVATAALQTLIATANVPAGLQAMTAAGWTRQNLGVFCGTVKVGAVSDADLLLLMQNANFRTGSVAMIAVPWTPVQVGEFVVGAVGAPLAIADIGALVNTGGFPANARAWVTAGFTAREVGTVCREARLANGGAFAAVPLVAFLGTANAAAAAFALRGQATWTPANIGTTVGHCRTQGGPPTDAEMVQLLQRANVAFGTRAAPMRSTWLQNAATADFCGAPAWAQVLAHLQTFQASWISAGAAGRVDQAPVVNVGAHGGPPYRVEIRLRGERIDHVEERHTFEYHLFTYANCTRLGVGVGGNSSFVPVGTNVTNVLVAVQGSGTCAGIAENAAWAVQPTQGNTLGYRFGVLSAGAAYGPPPMTYPTYLSQCYPTAGTNIVGRDLVAIGRISGMI